MKRLTQRILSMAVGMMLPAAIVASVPADTFVYKASLTGVASTATFAPYFNSALVNGRISQGQAAQIDLSAAKPLQLARRWDWAVGVEALAGVANRTSYERYSDGLWTDNRQSTPHIWLQQLYATAKWRCLYLTAGMKEYASPLLDPRLTSGDLIESGNASPILQGRIGFVDYQDIPFTRGWVQIDVQLAYGKLLDNKWWREHYDYYNGHICQGALYHYKRVYFRTRQSAPFAVTIGVQSAAQFGGTTDFYYRGILDRTLKAKSNLRAWWDVLIPNHSGDDGYYEGNTLGSWDFKARYRLRSGHEFAAYFQWPWEDGSGMGKLNGWDGLWGVEWHAPRPGIISAAAVEWIDFRNQSGPMHYAPGDFPGTTIEHEATGDDDYYNNAFYNSYAYYGLGIGSPFLLSPLYNRNGQMSYLYNRAHGMHLALVGQISPRLDYNVRLGWEKAWGAGRTPSVRPKECYSGYVGVNYTFASVPGLHLAASVAFDAGSLRPNNVGTVVTLSYQGLFTR